MTFLYPDSLLERWHMSEMSRSLHLLPDLIFMYMYLYVLQVQYLTPGSLAEKYNLNIHEWQYFFYLVMVNLFHTKHFTEELFPFSEGRI